MKKIIFNEEELKDIISLYVNDIWGTRQIGKKYSVSEKTINRVLKENNVDIFFIITLQQSVLDFLKIYNKRKFF